MEASLHGNPVAILERILFCHDLDVESTVPATVEEVYNNGTVLVKPLIKIVDGENEIERKGIVVPIRKESHGGFYVEHPVMKGDTGWVFASQRDSSLARRANSSEYPDENKGAQTPNKNKNLHKYQFGFFIPDKWITVDKELVKSLDFAKSFDGRSLCGGEYVIGSSRNKAGNLDYSAKFGVVRDAEGNDVPYTTDIEGHTHALVGDFTGEYFWQMFKMLGDGSVDIYGQGKKFSIREDGLYLDDRPLELTGGVTSILGENEDDFKSEQIEGDVAAHAENGSGLIIKTKIVEKKTKEHPQKSEMIVDLAGRKEVKFGIKTLKVYNDQGEVETELKFFAEKDLDLPGLLAEDGIEITKTEDGNVLKIKNTGVLQVQQGSNITIDNLGDGKFKINASIPDPPAPPTVNDGTFTVQYNSVTVGTFTANQASNSSATIPLVDKKADTEGIDVTQPNGDNKVKIENTGLTGVHLQQSGAARYLQVTGGTDVQHGGVNVKTKDITITTGVPQSIEEVEATTPIENAIGVSIEQKGSAQNMDLEEIVTLTLDADKANCTLEIDGEEATKFFGTEDVDVGTKTISAGEGISVSVSTDGKIITISATGETSGYTGSRVVVVESDYSHPYLRQHKERWEFENGLLKSDGITDLGWSTITQAVEETVNV